MHFWNTRQLIRLLKAKELTQRQEAQYLALFIILYAIAVFVQNHLILNNKPLSAPFFYLFIGITFLGFVRCFLANFKSDNQDFVTRFVCLSIPVLFRVAALGILLTLLAITLEPIFPWQEFTNQELLKQLAALVLPVAYFGQLTRVIHKTARYF